MKPDMYRPVDSNGLVGRLKSGVKYTANAIGAAALSIPLAIGAVPQTGYSTIDNTVGVSRAHGGEKAKLEQIAFPDYKKAKEKTSDVLVRAGFKKATASEYQDAVKSEARLITFLYNDTKPRGNFGLAKAFEHLLSESNYQNIAFLAIDANKTSNKKLTEISLTISPSVSYHVNGKLYGISKGGPANLEGYKKQIDEHRKWLEWVSQFVVASK